MKFHFLLTMYVIYETNPLANATPENMCTFAKGSGMSSGLQRVHQEERPSVAPPTFYSDDEEDEQEKISMPQVCV